MNKPEEKVLYDLIDEYNAKFSKSFLSHYFNQLTTQELIEMLRKAIDTHTEIKVDEDPNRIY